MRSSGPRPRCVGRTILTSGSWDGSFHRCNNTGNSRTDYVTCGSLIVVPRRARLTSPYPFRRAPQVVYVLREVHNRVAIGVLALLQDGEMLRYLAQTTPARSHKGQPDPTPGGDPDPDLARLLPRYTSAALLVLPDGCSSRCAWA
jgi:hypothetical protein